MARVQKSQQARQDVAEIATYIARDTVSASDRWLSDLDELLVKLAEFPYMGTTRRWFATSLRMRVYGRYLLFYRPIDDGIELVRVIHGARRIHRGMFT